MDIYIVRHAWAVDRDDPRWPEDQQRPLTEVGKERFARMVEKLGERGMKPHVIATSPLVRCVETAQLLAAGTGNAKVVELEELWPGSDINGLLRWTADQAYHEKAVAWVGHAPDVNWLTAALIGGDSLIRFPKGAVAAVRFDGLPSLGQGELQWLVTAKILGVLSS